MSWEPLPWPVKVTHAKGLHRLAPVTLRVSKRGRYAQLAYLTVRTHLLDGGLPWWTHGAGVDVMIGRGEHAGMLRIIAGSMAKLTTITGSGKGKLLPPMLKFFALEGMPEGGTAPLAVSFDHNDGWIEVTLPKWAADAPVKGTPTASPIKAPPPAPMPELAPLKVRGAAPPAAASAAPVPPEHNRKPVERPYALILDWAIDNGVGNQTHGFDLGKVNALRAEQGMRPFVIQKTRRAA